MARLMPIATAVAAREDVLSAGLKARTFLELQLRLTAQTLEAVTDIRFRRVSSPLALPNIEARAIVGGSNVPVSDTHIHGCIPLK